MQIIFFVLFCSISDKNTSTVNRTVYNEVKKGS